jgi:hypothetical protein
MKMYLATSVFSLRHKPVQIKQICSVDRCVTEVLQPVTGLRSLGLISPNLWNVLLSLFIHYLYFLSNFLIF